MYEKMYHITFNGITDALREMEKKNYGRAEEILKKAQCDAEEVYMSWGEDGEESPEEER